jgi:hypothetical protein
MLLVCALLLVVPCICRAEDPATLTVVRLTVTPAAAPKPALKYQLLPELREMNPGNPIQAYLKCFMEQSNFYYNKESIDKREKWQTMPLKDLPLFELRNYGGSGLRQADFAARLDTPDWQILPQLKSEGVHLLLPEVQQLRQLASALKVRFRGEVADQRFEDAVRTAKTMFALSRHLGEHPALISNLVGIAIAAVAIGPLEEMIEQPSCPNLYWALANLPDPLIDLRKGMQGERMMFINELAVLDGTAPMSDAQLKKAVEKIRLLLQYTRSDPGALKEDVADWLQTRVKDDAKVRAARQRLIDYGLAAEQVKAFPALQVVLLDGKREYEVRRDEEMKWMGVDYWKGESTILEQLKTQEGQELLLGQLLPACLKVRRAQARVQQRIRLLQHVEAVRLYAAEHGGKLPAQLSDIPVPLPVDPYTGKPFLYSVEGETAVVQGCPPRGQEKIAAYNVRYEVTIKK